MTKIKQKPLPLPAEYRLLITHRYSEQLKMIVVFVGLRTIEEFGNFRYEIVVVDKITDHMLKLDIHGLRAPRQNLPSFGPATFRKEYPDLKGVDEVVVARLDGEENSYQIKITKDNILVKQAPQKVFVQLVTREEEW